MTNLKIGAKRISGDTRHIALADGVGGWRVSWLPGRRLDLNQAVTAMLLAETVEREEMHAGNRYWSAIAEWAGQLGLSAPDAVVRASQAPHEVRP